MKKELLVPLGVLALGLAAAGGFFAASAALSEGGGQKPGGSRVVVQEHEENDEAAPPAVVGRAFAGLVLEERRGGEGVRIRQVVPGGPADDAGLEAGDIITAVNGETVESVDDVRAALENKNPGDRVTFSVRRDNQEEEIDVTLGARAGVMQIPSQAAPGRRMQAYLGVELADITPEVRRELGLLRDQGVAIVQVDSDGPAYDAGLRRGDVILQIGSQWVETAQGAVAAILDHEPGDEVSLLIQRNSQELRVDVSLGFGRVTGGGPVDAWVSQPLSLDWLRSLLSDLGLDPDAGVTNLQEIFERFVRADVVLLDKAGQPVELHVVAGTLAGVSDTDVRLSPNGGGAELRYSVTEKTRFVRGLVQGEVQDLRPGDRALVLTRSASNEALLVLSPSFALEGGLSAVPVPGVPQLILPFEGVY